MHTRMTLSIVLLILLSSFARAEWRFEGETGVVYDSNLSNSDRSADVRDDWAWKSDITAGNGLQVTRDLRLNLGADLRSELWDRFGAFNTIGRALRLAYAIASVWAARRPGFCWRTGLATIDSKTLHKAVMTT